MPYADLRNDTLLPGGQTARLEVSWGLLLLGLLRPNYTKRCRSSLRWQRLGDAAPARQGTNKHAKLGIESRDDAFVEGFTVLISDSAMAFLSRIQLIHVSIMEVY